MVGAMSLRNVVVALAGMVFSANAWAADPACPEAPVAMAWAPASGEADTILFEDNWPKAGDLDFNDVAVHYSYAFHLDGSQPAKTVSITATYNAVALGGTFNNGLSLHLPVPASAVSSITRRVGSGAAQSIMGQLSSADADLTVELSNNLRELFDGTPAGPINAFTNVPRRTGHAMEVRIVFVAPVALDLTRAPFDVFVFRTESPAHSHEIHLPKYLGSAAMDELLYGTADDDTNKPGEARSFISRGLPFALIVPSTSAYPREQTPIDRVYPGIVNFARTGGAEDADFYEAPTELVYEDAAHLPPPSPAFLSCTTAAPSAPTGVTATPGSNQLLVDWSASATNGGSAITAYRVTLNPAPTGGQPALVSLPHALSLSVTGLTNGTPYVASVQGVNAAGTGSAGVALAVTPFGLPGAPGVSAAAGDGQATISWSAASANGSALTAYQITLNPAPSGGQPANVAAGTLSKVVTGLTNGTAYAVSVRAVNAAGIGAAGSTLITTFGLPTAPSSVTATPGDSQATISWPAVPANGSAITAYKITLSPVPSGGQPANVSGSTLSKVVTGLSNGATYTVSVQAINAAGTGPVRTKQVVAYGLPGAPTGLAANADDGQATLTWSAAQGNGSNVTAYRFTFTPAPSGGQPADLVPGTLTKTVTGLTNGTAYSVSVQAINAAGTGSAATGSVTPLGFAGAPTAVSASAGNSQATVSWTAPSNNGGSAITSYTIVAYTASASVLTVSASSSPKVVTGLTNGIAYYFEVSAVTARGQGAAAASAVVTPAAPPGSTSYSSAGAYEWTVPAGVTSIRVVATGASGGQNNSGPVSSAVGTPAGGGTVAATLAVTPGEKLTIVVGGAGAPQTGGYNGGGTGAIHSGNRYYAGGGGGATDVRRGSFLTDRILVAGGGGGRSFGNTNSAANSGGEGGGLYGIAGTCFNNNGLAVGFGGSPTAGGAGGLGSSLANDGTAGSSGYGGNGGKNSFLGGGGGGGYYGGGGGGSGGSTRSGTGGGGSGGGGGSSYVLPSATNVVHTTGTQLSTPADGTISITW